MQTYAYIYLDWHFRLSTTSNVMSLIVPGRAIVLGYLISHEIAVYNAKLGPNLVISAGLVLNLLLCRESAWNQMQQWLDVATCIAIQEN
jgi:hypothetical protein